MKTHVKSSSNMKLFKVYFMVIQAFYTTVQVNWLLGRTFLKSYLFYNNNIWRLYNETVPIDDGQLSKLQTQRCFKTDFLPKGRFPKKLTFYSDFHRIRIKF